MIEYSMIFITMVDMVFLRHGTTVVGSLIFLFAYCFFRARVVPGTSQWYRYQVPGTVLEYQVLLEYCPYIMRGRLHD